MGACYNRLVAALERVAVHLCDFCRPWDTAAVLGYNNYVVRPTLIIILILCDFCGKVLPSDHRILQQYCDLNPMEVLVRDGCTEVKL